MTKENEYLTHEDGLKLHEILRDLLELSVIQNEQIKIMQQHINVLGDRLCISFTQPELEDALEGLKEVHAAADVEKKEREPRRDAKGNIIPWDEQHDYFFAFNPDDPDVPTD